MLRSEANLVASLTAPWLARARSGAAAILARLAARAKGSAQREIRCALPGVTAAQLAQAKERFGAAAPFGLPGAGQPLTFHAPAGQVFGFCAWLTGLGARSISVAALDFIFEPEN